jgi:hypothetical protein
MLTLRVRWIGRFFGPEDLSVRFSSVRLVSPAKPPFGLGGIDITLPDGRDFYFWTREVDFILRCLSIAGFPVSWERHIATKAWSREP